MYFPEINGATFPNSPKIGPQRPTPFARSDFQQLPQKQSWNHLDIVPGEAGYRPSIDVNRADLWSKQSRTLQGNYGPARGQHKWVAHHRKRRETAKKGAQTSVAFFAKRAIIKIKDVVNFMDMACPHSPRKGPFRNPCCFVSSHSLFPSPKLPFVHESKGGKLNIRRSIHMDRCVCA